MLRVSLTLTPVSQVLSSQTEVSSVIVNQHVESWATALMLRLRHDGDGGTDTGGGHLGGGDTGGGHLGGGDTGGGCLDLTPDHVLLIDGAMRPAREAVPGSLLDTGSGAGFG